MRPEHRQSYTWVELVVIVGVILFLLALLLPALQEPRSGRRSTCANNMRNLALAVANYAHAKGAYPGYLNSLATRSGTAFVPEPCERDAGEARVTWIVCVLPYLERGDIYQFYRRPEMARVSGVDPRTVYVDVLVCPAAGQTRKPGSPPPCSYAANTGRADVVASAADEGHAGYPADWLANGVFFNHFHDAGQNPVGAPLEWIRQEFIITHDGSSATVMLSERVDAGSYSFPPSAALDAEAALGLVWWPSQSDKPPFRPPLASQGINGPADAVPINCARPSSSHSGVVNVAFCDGHCRSISQEIDYGVWCLLMTPNGRHCNDPGKAALELESTDNNYHYLRFTDIDEPAVQ